MVTQKARALCPVEMFAVFGDRVGKHDVGVHPVGELAQGIVPSDRAQPLEVDLVLRRVDHEQTRRRSAA